MFLTLRPQNRLLFILKTVNVALIAGIVLSYNLWLSDRFFPLAPVFDFIPPLPSPLDGFVVTALLFLLLNSTWKPKKLLNHLILAMLFLLCLQDQSRWQPWVYVYSLFLIPFSIFKPTQQTENKLLPYFQVILTGVYVWSGIHKLHPEFINDTFTSILTKFLRLSDPELIQQLLPIGYGIGIMEMLIGLALLLPQTRKPAVWLAAAMHVFILLYLSPLGINHNIVVFPWNLAMIVLVFLCFYKVENSPVNWFKNEIRINALTAAAILLAWFMPALNFVGHWDFYASFALYSNKVSKYYIVVGESELPKIDARFKPYFSASQQINGGEIIDVNSWSLGELNIPVYPESRVFRQICRTFCNLNMAEEQLYFVEVKPGSEPEKTSTFTCSELTRTLAR